MYSNIIARRFSTGKYFQGLNHTEVTCIQKANPLHDRGFLISVYVCVAKICISFVRFQSKYLNIYHFHCDIKSSVMISDYIFENIIFINIPSFIIINTNYLYQAFCILSW